MVFGIDADGVIVDLLTVWVEKYNVMYKDDLSVQAFVGSHDPHETVKKSAAKRFMIFLKSLDSLKVCQK